MMTTSLGRVLARLGALVCALGLALTLAAPAHATSGARQATAESGEEETAEPTWAHSSKWLRPLMGWRIALDPGHNGGNSAAPGQINELVSDGRGGTKMCNSVGTSTDDGYPEHAFTFDVSTRLSELLTDLGATVVTTREDDDGTGPCVDIRGRFAEDQDVDLMLSLHANGSEDQSAEGFFAIISDPPLSASQGEPSQDLAQTMVEALTDAGFTSNPAIEDSIAERDDLATLNFSRRPTVLLELGEMRNPDEAVLMSSAQGRQSYAQALADGVLEWSRNNEAGSTR